MPSCLLNALSPKYRRLVRRVINLLVRVSVIFTQIPVAPLQQKRVIKYPLNCREDDFWITRYYTL